MDIFNASSTKLHVLTPPWPFLHWGLDILNPFSPTTDQLMYLIVALEYFIKWIEAEELVNNNNGSLKILQKKHTG